MDMSEESSEDCPTEKPAQLSELGDSGEQSESTSVKGRYMHQLLHWSQGKESRIFFGLFVASDDSTIMKMALCVRDVTLGLFCGLSVTPGGYTIWEATLQTISKSVFDLHRQSQPDPIPNAAPFPQAAPAPHRHPSTPRTWLMLLLMLLEPTGKSLPPMMLFLMPLLEPLPLETCHLSQKRIWRWLARWVTWVVS